MSAFKAIGFILFAGYFFFPATVSIAQTTHQEFTGEHEEEGSIKCSGAQSPYRDLDFLVGTWNFFNLEDQKIADQSYQLLEDGCLILENWRTLGGQTGRGMNFVDPFTGKWRQVWMSSNFFIDASGKLIEPGRFVLLGQMYSNNDKIPAQYQGVYSRLEDGTIRKTFFRRAHSGEPWQQFFGGVAERSNK